MEDPDASSGRIWSQLSPELAEHIASFVEANELACTLRLVNRAAAEQFRSPAHRTVRLAGPIPRHAFAQQWGSPSAWRTVTLANRRKVMRRAAVLGDVPNLEAAIKYSGCSLTVEVFAAAAGAGQLAACEALLRHNCPWGIGVMAAAARSSKLDVCRFLRTHSCPWMGPYCTQLAVSKAVGESGDVAVLDWYAEYHPSNPPSHDGPCEAGDNATTHAIPESELQSIAESAARSGHLPLLEKTLELLESMRDQGVDLFEDDPEAPTYLVAAVACGMDVATLKRFYSTTVEAWIEELGVMMELRYALAEAAGSSTACWSAKVEWLLELGCTPDDCTWDMVSQCAGDGAVGRFKWFAQRGFPPSDSAADSAVNAGNVAAVEYLVAECGRTVHSRNVEHALNGGHPGMLDVLYQHGYQLDRMYYYVLWHAAEEQQWATVRQMVDEVAGSTAEPMVIKVAAAAAAKAGCGLDLLKFLHQRGFAEIDISCLAANGSEEGLEWALANSDRAELRTLGFEPYQSACDTGNMVALACMRRHKLPLKAGKEDILHTAENAPFPALRWLFEQGIPVPAGLADALEPLESELREARYHPAQVAWLREQHQKAGRRYPPARKGRGKAAK